MQILVETCMNEPETCVTADAELTHESSDLVLHELVNDRGETKGFYRSHQEATEHMHVGWTIRPAGEFIHQRADCGPIKVA